MHFKQTVWLALIASTFAGLAASEERRDIAFQSQITRVQPMTGIVLWSDNSIAAQHSDAITLEYRYCGYDEVVQPDGTYDYTKIDQILDEIAKRNHQAVLRFYFCYVGKATTVPAFIRNRPEYQETVGKSEKQKTHFCDWSNAALQSFALEFYTRFAKRYDNDPRIAFLQTGFGLWAEFHIYDGPREIGKTFPSKEYQERFLRHLNGQFKSLPWSISIDAADYDYTPLEDNDELLALEFGVFDDSFLCKPHPKENALNWKTLGPDRWKRRPGGGEFSYYNKRDQKNSLSPNGPNGVSFEKAAKQFHITYMIGNDQPRYQPIERIASAGRATGYRFRLDSAVASGGNVTLTVTNDGVAPIYRDAYFAAGKIRSQTSLRGLLPGETLTCTIKNVSQADLSNITIECDSILPTQTIQFQADLK
ncbi:beta-galactosidase [Planctomycetes bacterium K23_9]|uniref:Glycoside hydrolase family 42 N-terminal domain-containing protein n=1 Tax=Stieleria marina TaxID=1930275 RepID=A0A517NXB3_9BACT|nr:hypothetical protein K239x_37730 [Planctomycetes bacterium K23_9]